MLKFDTLQTKNPVRNWILWGIPALFIAGSIMHFVYEWSGNFILVGAIAPINESVWEHLKMPFYPILIWWFLGYLIYGKRNGIAAAQWFVSCTAAQLVCSLVILSFYYTYTGALGIESLILDIFSLFLGVAAGQGFALHIYKYAKLKQCWLYGAVIVLILIAGAFTFFTVAPPHIPLFKVSLTGEGDGLIIF